MSVTDPIADMLNRIRNALAAGRDTAVVPHSILKEQIAGILKNEGYVVDFAVSDAGKKAIVIRLKYTADGESVITGLRRMSMSGLRRYVKADKIPKVLGGMGTAIVSTSSGLMTGRDARKKRLGGELVCTVW
jgi:small subunit ribosomal protein S8